MNSIGLGFSPFFKIERKELALAKKSREIRFY